MNKVQTVRLRNVQTGDVRLLITDDDELHAARYFVPEGVYTAELVPLSAAESPKDSPLITAMKNAIDAVRPSPVAEAPMEKVERDPYCEHHWAVEAGYGPRGHGAAWCVKCGISQQDESRSPDGDGLPIVKGLGDERALPPARGDEVASGVRPQLGREHASGNPDRNDDTPLKPAAGSEPADSHSTPALSSCSTSPQKEIKEKFTHFRTRRACPHTQDGAGLCSPCVMQLFASSVSASLPQEKP